jgi:hypothetical protein
VAAEQSRMSAQTSQVSYGEMRGFFGGLHEIAKREHGSVQARNAEITAYVGSWHATAADAGA